MSDPSPQQPDTNAELVRRAQLQERAAFERLALRCRPGILATVRGRVAEDEAEDVVQEILLRAWEKLPGLRDPQAFPAWISTLAVNACRGWFRRSGRRSVSLDDIAQLPAPSPDPLHAVLRCEESVELREALNAIPEDNRRALIMHLWGRYEYAEIAERLGLSLPAVASRIRRAKLQLRDLLRLQQPASGRSTPQGGATMTGTARRGKLPLLIPQIGHTGHITRMAVSPDGTRFASVDDAGSLIIRDFETGRQELRITDHGYVETMCFSPDGSRFAFLNRATKTAVYDVERGVQLFVLPAEGMPLAFDASGQRLWTSWWTPDSDGKDWAQTNLFCWDLASKTVVRRVENLSGSYKALSADGSRVVTLTAKPVWWRPGNIAGMDNVELVVWDVATGAQISRLSGMEGYVHNAAISPDGRLVAAAAWVRDAPRVVLVWDVDSGELLHKLHTEEPSVGALVFMSDSSTLASASVNGAVIFWNARTGKKRHRIVNDGMILALAFTPDETKILMPGKHPDSLHSTPRLIRVRDWESGEEFRSFSGHGCWTNSGEFSPDGRTFAVCGPFSNVLRWDMETGALSEALPVPEGFAAQAITHLPDGKLGVAATRYGMCMTHLSLWERGEAEPVRKRNVEDVFINRIACDTEGKYAALGAGEPVLLVDIAKEEVVRELRGYDGKTRTEAVSFTPNGKGLACVVTKYAENGWPERGAAVIWDVGTGQEIRRWEDEQIYKTLAFSPDGESIVLATVFPRGTNDSHSAIRMHDVESGDLLREFAIGQLDGHVAKMAFSPNGRILAAGSNCGTVYVWDPATGDLLRTLDSEGGCVEALDFSPDGGLLAVAGHCGAVVVWQVADVLTSKAPRPAVTLVAVDQGADWFAYTPQGYYDCSPGAEQYLLWRKGNEFLGPDAVSTQLHRPDKIRQSLAAAGRSQS